MRIPGRADEDQLAALREIVERVPLGAGVLAGAGTFFGGYVAFFALLVATGAVDFGRSVVEILRSVGLTVYNAHNVPTLQQQHRTVEQNGEVVGEAVTRIWQNTITDWQHVQQRVFADGEVVQEMARTGTTGADPTLPALVYLAVPVVVLVVAAAVFTHRMVETRRLETSVAATITGVAVAGAFTLGYLVVVLLGSYALAVQGTGEGAFLRPARLEALGYGIAYPFVAAGLGAGFVLGRTQTDER